MLKVELVINISFKLKQINCGVQEYVFNRVISLPTIPRGRAGRALYDADRSSLAVIIRYDLKVLPLNGEGSLFNA